MRAPFALASLLALAAPSFAQFKPLFDAPVVVGGTDTRFVKTLDLDGDGWTDALSWWQTGVESNDYATNTIAGWLNDGTGKLTRAWTTTFTMYTDATLDPHDASATGDIDLDGKDDFVIADEFVIRIYRSNGAGGPTLFPQVLNGHFRGVVLADFDLDGRLDLAVADMSVLRIYTLDFAAGTATVLSEYATAFTTTGPLVAAELTGDTTPDLLQSGCRIYPVIGGAIQAPSIFQFYNADSVRHDVGDIDGDGDLDVVTFRVYTGSPATYRVLRRTGPGTFDAEPLREGGPARRLFDLDGDGDLDGTCCGGGGGNYPPQNTVVSKFRMAWNDGTGNFAPSIDMPGLGSTAIAGVVDMNHDGFVDWVAGRCVYYASGPIVGSPLVPFGTRVQNERTLHDFDWEGDPDAELTLAGVQVNLGDGVAQVARQLSLPPPPAGFTRTGEGMPGDWDGDSVVDLLVLLGTPTAPDGLELLRNVGCGAFESKGVVAGPNGLTASIFGGPGGFPTKVEDSLAADMDGDGDLDLVLRTYSAGLSGVTNPNNKWSAWMRNDGPLGFSPGDEFDLMLVLRVDDLNGDAIPDLLGAQWSTPGNWVNEPLKLAPGLGGGAFAQWTILPDAFVNLDVPGQVDQVVVTDVDLDGDKDVVLANRSGSSASISEASVLLNDGTGSFDDDDGVDALNLFINVGSQFGAALATDLNADGLTDLAFGSLSQAGNAAAIVLRKADDSGWEPPLLQVMFEQIAGTTNWNTHLSSRDPDGDRDPDLITDRMVSNRLYEGTQAGIRRQQQGGQAGTGGIVPTLGASGPFRVGMVARLRLRGGRPGTVGELLVSEVSSQPAPFGSGLLARARVASYVSVITSGTPGDPAGSGTWTSTFPVPADLAGRTFRYEVLLVDPAGPSTRSRSNALLLTYGW